MSDSVTLEPANPGWPRLFEEEKARLLEAFPAHFRGLEHIGSTAVPGLDAKPIIDILGGVTSLAEADALLEPLCELGWDTSPAFNSMLPDRRFLLRWPEGVRTHHLHLVVYGSEAWHERLKFRDYLRARPDVAQRYLALKLELAERYHNDREAYTDAKTAFVKEVLETSYNTPSRFSSS